MKLTDHVIRRFDAKYKEGNTPWFRGVIPSLVKRLAKLAAKEKHERLLDIGCGNGWLAVFLAEQGIEVYGIDGSPLAIAQAKKMARAKGVNGTHFKIGDALEFPYRDKSFDIIFDRGFLHHLPEKEWGRYKKGIDRLLTPGGLFYLSVFSERSYKKGFSPKESGRMWNRVKDPSGYWTYDHFFNRALIDKMFGVAYELVHIEEEPKPTAEGTILIECIFRKH